MCDFREITKIEIFGKEINVNPICIKWEQKDTIIVPGLYHLCATGSTYTYFDGNIWYSEKSNKLNGFIPAFIVTEYYQNLGWFCNTCQMYVLSHDKKGKCFSCGSNMTYIGRIKGT